MNIDITQIAVALIALLSAVITGFIIPWLKSKISINNDKLSDNQRALLTLSIETAVKAAEQLFYSEEGEKKKAYVLSILRAQGFDVDSSALDAEVEKMVFDVHSAMKKQKAGS